MTQILQAGSVNVLALGSPKAVVAIQTPSQPIVGVQVNILGYIGVGSWGPVNVPQIAGGNDEQVSNFGPQTNRKYDLTTAVAVAVQQFCSSFNNVRVTDGTDTLASGTYATTEVATTATVAGTPKVGDILTLTFTPTMGSATVINYTLPAGPPSVTAIALAIVALINANATLVAAGFAATSALGVISIYGVGGVSPPTGWTSVTPSVSGSSPTTTFTGSTASGSTVKLTLTGLYTGVVGNGLVPTLQPGTAANSTKLIIGRPGYVAEIYDNLLGTGNLLWVNAAAAVNNGNSPFRGPSQLCTATAGLGGAAGPATVSTITMSGGTDGAAIAESALLGTDTAPRKGAYALRNQGCGVVCPVDSGVTTYWASYAPLGQSEGFLVECATVSGDTLTNAATELSAAGVDSYALKVDFGDWVYWFDTANNTQRLLSPATFLAAKRANQSPQNSVLNKQINGVIGTQKTLAGGTWTDADKDALYSYRMDLLCNPVQGGPYWGSNMGINTSSNPAINGDNYTMMVNFISRSVAQWAGTNIGLLQTPTQRLDAKALADNFFNNMWQLGYIGNADSANGIGAPPWSVLINDQTTPPNLAAAGYEICAVRVQFLAVIRWFVVNLMGGQTVNVTVSATQPSFV